jgi:hypothetical protein
VSHLGNRGEGSRSETGGFPALAPPRLSNVRLKEINKKDSKEYLVNRTEGMAFLGGAGLDNEECYLWSKFARAMGVANLEHQARLCHSSTVAGLAASFGRGAMTNHWIDLKNSDAILAIGCNPAENHPVSFKWIEAALDSRGLHLHFASVVPWDLLPDRGGQAAPALVQPAGPRKRSGPRSPGRICQEITRWLITLGW